MNKRGFTLVELIIALVLLGIVGTAIYQLLTANQRIYREQSERVDVNQSARAAISILPGEIRELNAGDPAGSDLIAMTASSLTYKAMRNLYVLCAPPVSAAFQVILDATQYGLRALDASTDSLLLFAEGDPTTRTDDQWLHANIVSIATGTACLNGDPSLTVSVGGLTVAQLDLVQDGAPVRGFEIVEALLYSDALGDTWLGGRRWMKTGGWTATEPIVGPLAAGGMALVYYDSLGVVTATPGDVARIAITVEAQSGQRVRSASGTEYLLQDLVTSVALRNNPTY